jgi:hypothetical protein
VQRDNANGAGIEIYNNVSDNPHDAMETVSAPFLWDYSADLRNLHQSNGRPDSWISIRSNWLREGGKNTSTNGVSANTGGSSAHDFTIERNLVFASQRKSGINNGISADGSTENTILNLYSYDNVSYWDQRGTLPDKSPPDGSHYSPGISSHWLIDGQSWERDENLDDPSQLSTSLLDRYDYYQLLCNDNPLPDRLLPPDGVVWFRFDKPDDWAKETYDPTNLSGIAITPHGQASFKASEGNNTVSLFSGGYISIDYRDPQKSLLRPKTSQFSA